MAHELGHNFGLEHAPCYVDTDLDPNYPYPGAKIGTWGYDLVNRELKDPDLYYDIMSPLPGRGSPQGGCGSP
jgi:hypothetical protein